jgi:hypothetical protein
MSRALRCDAVSGDDAACVAFLQWALRASRATMAMISSTVDASAG